MSVKRGKRSTNYFIIQYSPSWCHIVLLDTYEGIRMKEIYDAALTRYSAGGKIDKDPIVAWNNSFWWIGKAMNSGEFMKKFMSRMNKRVTDMIKIVSKKEDKNDERE